MPSFKKNMTDLFNKIDLSQRNDNYFIYLIMLAMFNFVIQCNKKKIDLTKFKKTKSISDDLTVRDVASWIAIFCLEYMKKGQKK